MVRLKKLKGFPYHRVIGNIAKEIVRGLLDESGYIVYPYGYESFLSYIKCELHKKQLGNTDSIQRTRSHPDLLVYEKETNEVRFVEVKFRNRRPEKVGLKAYLLRWYRNYWNDSILVVVIPSGEIFYAQYIDKVPLLDTNDDLVDFNLATQFCPIHELFDRINKKLIVDYYADLVRQIPNFKLKCKEDESIIFE